MLDIGIPPKGQPFSKLLEVYLFMSSISKDYRSILVKTKQKEDKRKTKKLS